MASPAERPRYTFADCLTWDENERIELIDGDAFMMAPPSSLHQKICFELGRQLGNFLEGKKARFIRRLSAFAFLSRKEILQRMWIRWSNRISP